MTKDHQLSNRKRASTPYPLRGALPTWLTGSLVRIGPDRSEVGEKRYNHWSDGMTMLHAFRLAAGRVSYANRYLRSQTHTEAMAKGTISRRPRPRALLI